MAPPAPAAAGLSSWSRAPDRRRRSAPGYWVRIEAAVGNETSQRRERRPHSRGEGDREDVEEHVDTRDPARRVAGREGGARGGGSPVPGADGRAVDLQEADDQKDARIQGRRATAQEDEDQRRPRDRAEHVGAPEQP